jgi:hypothetical protein
LERLELRANSSRSLSRRLARSRSVSRVELAKTTVPVHVKNMMQGNIGYGHKRLCPRRCTYSFEENHFSIEDFDQNSSQRFANQINLVVPNLYNINFAQIRDQSVNIKGENIGFALKNITQNRMEQYKSKPRNHPNTKVILAKDQTISVK